MPLVEGVIWEMGAIVLIWFHGTSGRRYWYDSPLDGEGEEVEDKEKKIKKKKKLIFKIELY